MTTYTSTNCLKNPVDVIRVLEKYKSGGIKHVELGSVHKFFDIRKLKNFQFDFLVHNYFPPPEIPFNFNLASSDDVIKDKSIKLARKAIDLCEEIGCSLYTFHAGFTVDPNRLGKPFTNKNLTEREKSFEIFCESVLHLIDYAKKTNVRLAMEPNVVQEFNLTNGKNEMLLFADYDEIEQLYRKINKKYLGLLLDLGHTAVTAHWLNFDRDKFVANCADKVSAVHISNNDGKRDQHKGLTKNCWQVYKLKLFKKVPIILETVNLDIKEIKNNILIVQNSISEPDL